MEYLSQTEQQELERLRSADIWVAEVLAQEERILASRAFRGVHDRTKNLVRFIVATRLLGQSDALKETLIGMRVWEDESFDPLQTSKVRTAFGGLRKRLAAYYASERQGDPIEIRLADRGYVPGIMDRRIAIIVEPFQNMNLSGAQQYLCAALTDAVVDRLNHAGAIEARCLEIPVGPELTIRYGVKACLACRRDGTVSVTVWLHDLKAQQVIWDHSFEETQDDLLRLSQRVAVSVVSAVRPAPHVVPAAPQPKSIRRPPARATSREAEPYLSRNA